MAEMGRAGALTGQNLNCAASGIASPQVTTLTSVPGPAAALYFGAHRTAPSGEPSRAAAGANPALCLCAARPARW
ncbi:hypothetical protein GCM10018953_48100 [Streptosporangium nondiastaticum]